MKPYALLSCLFAAGCTFVEKSAPPPSFPLAAQVSELTVSRGSSIKERAAIDLFVSNLHSLKGNWSYTWHTYPTPRATVSLVGQSSSEVLCRIDIGPNWLGSTCGDTAKGWPPYTDLSREQAMKFRALVGGTWEVR